MKILSFLFLTFLTLNFTTPKITVKVLFENKSILPFERGTLTIKETGEKFEITSLDDFEINLESGKYQFSFTSKTNATVFYPSKIDSENRTLRIVFNKPVNLENPVMASSKNIKNLIKKGEAKFIGFGITIQDFSKFEKKYGIGLQNQGCVITSNNSKIAVQNNRFLEQYLTEKYGDSWKKDLPFLPFGLDN